MTLPKAGSPATFREVQPGARVSLGSREPFAGQPHIGTVVARTNGTLRIHWDNGYTTQLRDASFFFRHGTLRLERIAPARTR